jgi:hypothetical protein
MAFQESIGAAEHWKESFATAAEAVTAATPSRPWSVDASGGFVRLDIFVQRCR